MLPVYDTGEPAALASLAASVARCDGWRETAPVGRLAVSAVTATRPAVQPLEPAVNPVAGLRLAAVSGDAGRGATEPIGLLRLRHTKPAFARLSLLEAVEGVS